jgi:glucose-6-phosphate 1-dehydrogenase
VAASQPRVPAPSACFFELSPLPLSFHSERFENLVIPAAYERLILDVIRGDGTNFVRRWGRVCRTPVPSPLFRPIH